MINLPTSRYDLSLGSNKSSLSRSDGGTYDLQHAEIRHKENNNLPEEQLHNMSGSSTLGSIGGTSTTETRKRKWPTDKPYFLAKEILMTERTYKKDLEVINNWWRTELSAEDIENLQPLFQTFEGLIQHHNVFLRDLEHRLVLWEGRSSYETHRIGDVMLKNMVVLPLYEEYLENHREILERVNELYETDDRFQGILREFEQQKICYLPISYFLLKPLQRLLHYQLILEGFLDHYGNDHVDKTDCQGTLVMLSRTTEAIRQVLPDSENYILLCELQRDIFGFETLINADRKFIRHGCLLKHSKRGLQQKMFFLFSDILIYGSRSPVTQTFKILGHVPVRSLLTENGEHNAFVVFGGARAITVSAGTTAEKNLWLAELMKATAEIKSKPHVQLTVGSLKNCIHSIPGYSPICERIKPKLFHTESDASTEAGSSEEGLDSVGLSTPTSTATAGTSTSNATKTAPQPPSRNNTALHVCWHRASTISLTDHLNAAENQLSGYLLRKFKNSSGWQKLWVVFTSFCLYFYKNYQDDYSLASLPLLGYSVGPPGYQDSMQKEFVFKLSFKNHVYFFRAESEHTYNRWLHVLRTTTQTQDFKNNVNNIS